MSIIEQRLENLSKQHDNVYPIFAGAYYAYDSAQKADLETFVEFLPHVAQSAKLLNWHTGVAGALRTFCNLCMVDPMLIEAYLGVKFSKFNGGSKS